MQKGLSVTKFVSDPETGKNDTKMKQTKTCLSSQFVILLTILLGGCGNKGPLVVPGSEGVEPKSVESAATEVDSELVESPEKELEK